MIALETTNLFDGEAMAGRRAVLIEGGLIIDVAPHAPEGVETRHLPPGTILAPGFIDLQVNGGDGVLFNDEPNEAGLRRMAAAHVRDGTTSLLPTLISGSSLLQQRATEAVRAAIAQNMTGIAGIHIEGPYISRARRGIHPENAITSITADDLAVLSEEFPGVRLITLAPEVVPASKIAALAAADVAVFLGHSDATCEAALEALEAGAIGFTHLFNAMSQFGSRTPGVVGAALASDTSFASIIIDGHHVHPAAIHAAWRALGSARMCLISDAMPSVGRHGGDFMFAGRAIRLVDGRLTDAAGTLAGAHLTMREAVCNAVRLAGIPLPDALRMASATPADAVGLRDRGRIRAGARADLVALDHNLHVTDVWAAGRPIGEAVTSGRRAGTDVE